MNFKSHYYNYQTTSIKKSKTLQYFGLFNIPMFTCFYKFANSFLQVVDVGQQLSEVYSQVDPCSLEVLLIEVGYRLHTCIILFCDKSNIVMGIDTHALMCCYFFLIK